MSEQLEQNLFSSRCLISPRYILGDPEAVIRVGRNRSFQIFQAHLFCRPNDCPWVFEDDWSGKCAVWRFARVLKGAEIQTLYFCNYLCSVEFSAFCLLNFSGFLQIGLRVDLRKKKIAVSKMSGFVWTGNNSIPQRFSISMNIFNI